MRTVVIVIILALLAGGGWFGYQRLFGAPAPVEYETDKVTRGTVVSTVSATGTLEPLVKVLVGTQVSGTIMKWHADFNQRVTAGFVLAELDQDRFKAVLMQRKAAAAVAKAHVEEVKARLARVIMDRERVDRMAAREAATDYEHRTARAEEDITRAVLRAAEAQLLAAEADVQQAMVDMEKTVIRSPIDGIVISRDVDEGQTVAATMQAPTLFTIANDLTKMRVNAAVSEMDIGKVREGMKAEFRVDAYPERRFEGVVSQVRFAEKIENNVVTYTTLILVPNPELLLRPAMTARITFEVERAENVMTVANAAFRFVPESQSKEVRREAAGSSPRATRVHRMRNGKLEEVQVKPGLTDGKRTAVTTQDLQMDDVLVVGEPESATARRGRR